MYVVCLLFYAIGSVLVNLILFLIGQDWTIDYFSYLTSWRGRIFILFGTTTPALRASVWYFLALIVCTYLKNIRGGWLLSY